jgi:glutamate synthase domain-containing protein 3
MVQTPNGRPDLSASGASSRVYGGFYDEGTIYIDFTGTIGRVEGTFNKDGTIALIQHDGLPWDTWA